MKRLGRFAIYLILAFNAVFIGLLLLSAFSPYIDPEKHPIKACMGLTFPIFLVINMCFIIFWLIVRYKLALASFVALLICSSQIRTYIPVNSRTKNIPEENIKILSYNVMAFGDLKKTAGRNPVLTYMQESNADIICIQEYVVTANRKYVTRENIDQALKAYPYRNVQKLGDAKASANGIACYSKYPILSAKPLDYGSKSNGSIVYELKIGNDTVMLINNHLESNKLSSEDKNVYEDMIGSPEARKVKKGVNHLLKKLGEAQKIRAGQARIVARAIAASRHPYIIVCGDFNDSPVSYAHRVIAENLDDAFTTSGRGLGISFNQNKFYFRIDNILVSKNLKAHHCTVDHSIKNSDHYPVWCYISKR